MKGDLLALVVAADSGTESRPAKAPYLQPLLGKSSLELAFGAVACLKPKEVYLVTCRDKKELGRVDFFTGLGFLFWKGQPGNLSFLLSMRGILDKHRKKDLLIMDGRVPLLRPKTLSGMLGYHRAEKSGLTVLSGGLRISQRPGRAISGRKSTLAPASVVRIKDLLEVWDTLTGGKKNDLRLSRLIQALSSNNKKVNAYPLPPDEDLILETPAAVAAALRVLRQRKIRELEAKGVAVLDPLSTWVDLDVRVGRDTVLYPSVVIEGRSRLGKECRVYPFVHLINTKVGDRVRILSSTMIEGSRVEADAQVGPFAHFRPNTVLRAKAKVGNFVELKNTVFGPGSKAGHLSYLGDCVVGDKVNIGAGTITCNYDGLRKHQTVIESGAFIGSGTELVAPVKVGRNAYVGAGSTITKNVSDGALAVARSRQVEKPGWAIRRMKKPCAG
ncbi:MAG: DapH/DapD/GlmU-related protein [Clostridiales bacterium]|nr:DapH/DapD/GlmU-related protein [Clostridiales bacterium]